MTNLYAYALLATLACGKLPATTLEELTVNCLTLIAYLMLVRGH